MSAQQLFSDAQYTAAPVHAAALVQHRACDATVKHCSLLVATKTTTAAAVQNELLPSVHTYTLSIRHEHISGTTSELLRHQQAHRSSY
jgi:hypothetical protein